MIQSTGNLQAPYMHLRNTNIIRRKCFFFFFLDGGWEEREKGGPFNWLNNKFASLIRCISICMSLYGVD